jgi:hypothetical protein
MVQIAREEESWLLEVGRATWPIVTVINRLRTKQYGINAVCEYDRKLTTQLKIFRFTGLNDLMCEGLTA